MPQLPSLSRSTILFLLLALSLLLAATLGDQSVRALRYERTLLFEQWWRLLTAHWVHLGWSHTLLNLAGLGLIWALAGDLLSWRVWLALVLAAAPGISLLLWLCDPGLAWYVGFSGVLHALFVLAGAALWRSGQSEGLWLLVLLGLKLGYEQWQGATPGSAALAGGPVVVDAHLYGAVCGVVGYLLWRLVRLGAVRR